MVIIDPQDGKSPRGPRPVPQTPLGPPPYVPQSPHNSGFGLPSPPPRSPGVRPLASPYSAPPSNFLTIKRDRADITGSWHINTTLPPLTPSLGRTLSTGSDRESDVDAASEAGTHTGTDVSDPLSSAVPGSVSSATTSSSLGGSAARPNLKLFSPRGKIDAIIRVSGGPRAWLEAISREEDVAVTFPPNPSGAPRAPIKLLVRSTSGNVQVHLPAAFKGTLRVPSDTILPQSLRSQSVVLSPSEPPIDRPPILDEVSTKPKLGMGSLPSRSTTPTPPSPPPSAATAPAVAEGQRPQSPVIVLPAAPASPPAPSSDSVPVPAPSEPGSQSEVQSSTPPAPSEANTVERSSTGDTAQGAPMILEQLPVETPAQEVLPPLLHATSATPTLSSPPPNTTVTAPPIAPVTPPTSPPAIAVSPTSTLAVPTTSTSIPTPAPGHHRTFSSSSSHLPLSPAPAHESSESSTVYFIGDYLKSGYENKSPDQWEGDEFVLDSEHGRVRVWMYGEKAEVPWTEDVAGKMKDVMDWGKWKSAAAATGELVTAGSGKGGTAIGGMQLNMPKISMSGMARRFKFGK